MLPSRHLTLLLALALALPWVFLVGGCTGGPDDSASDASLHACVGFALFVDTSGVGEVDGEALVEAVEAELDLLSCDYRDPPAVLECVPVDAPDGCGFEDRAAAVTWEEPFRDALAEADPDLADYPHGVIDECYCRVY